MKKNYVTPGVVLIPMQIVGPNANVSGDDEEMQPIGAKRTEFDEEDFSADPEWGD